MRRVALAVLITAGSVAHAQTPYPVPVSPDEPKPTPVPVPIEELPPDQRPKPPPQPKQEEPKPTPTPVQQPKPPDQKPPQQPAQKPADQKTAPKAPDAKPDLKIEQRVEAPKPTEPPPSPINADLVGSAEIRKIVVEDNTKTTSETVEVIAGIEIGDDWTADMVDLVKTRLVSSGLFKDVEVYWTKEPGGVAVHILAKDKHSWVIAPAVYSQPTNKGGGVGFGENNLFGQNQKLLLYGQIATGDSFFIGAWLVPSIGGTRFYSQLDTYLKSARNIEYTAPTKWLLDPGDVRPVRESRIHYLNFGAKLGVELWRGVRVDARLRAASVSYRDTRVMTEAGATIGDIDPGGDPMMPPAPGKEGADISNEWSFTVDRRANWYGVQEGRKYTVSFEHSLESFGSDFDYWLTSVSAYRAVKVLDRHNFIVKGVINYGHHLPFQQELTTGGTSMRGWLNNEFRGDFRMLGNAEYSVPIFTVKGFSVRGLAFWDSAYTTFLDTKDNEKNLVRDYLRSGKDAEVRGLAGFKNSVGVGTRFYLRQIVLPLLGLDFGYGLEARDYQVYLAIGLTD